MSVVSMFNISKVNSNESIITVRNGFLHLSSNNCLPLLRSLSCPAGELMGSDNTTTSSSHTSDNAMMVDEAVSVKIFNIPRWVEKDIVEAELSQIDGVTEVTIPARTRSANCNRHQGRAFVQFECMKMATQFVESYNGVERQIGDMIFTGKASICESF
jgi:hypothetical protein